MPHFEKMLYTQALLARTYTDAARLSDNPYLADIAKSILDFVGGPLTDGNGCFYSAIDAETNGTEGAYYAWTVAEITSLLALEEADFLITFFALADIPHYPGHKEPGGQVLIARKALDVAAHEKNMPYVQLAAMAAQVMNKLLAARNTREAPGVDTKIIVAWNGLMIDAFAHAGRVLMRPDYTLRARRAADFLLEHAIDNNGMLKRIFNTNHAELGATLEDYAYLIRGLMSLHRASPNDELLNAAGGLMAQVEERFADAAGGYFFTPHDDTFWVRIKNGEDSALPSPNAIMLHNLLDMHEFTREPAYLEKAETLAAFFLASNGLVMAESASMVQAAMRLVTVKTGRKIPEVTPYVALPETEGQVVTASAALVPENARPGEIAELRVVLAIKKAGTSMPDACRRHASCPPSSTCRARGSSCSTLFTPALSAGRKTVRNSGSTNRRSRSPRACAWVPASAPRFRSCCVSSPAAALYATKCRISA